MPGRQTGGWADRRTGGQACRGDRPVALTAISVLPVLFLSVPSVLQAQTLTERVDGAPDGRVRMSYEAREDICYRRYDGSLSINSNPDGDEDEFWCDNEPVRVELVKEAGQIVAVRIKTAGRWRSRDRESAADLGAVDSREAARYMLHLLPHLGSRNRSRAIDAAALALDADIWPDLVRVAQSDESRGVRRKAVFWLGQEARRLLIDRMGEDFDNSRRDDQKAAVFALSQLKAHRGAPALVKVARTHRDPYVRGAAIFWLAQGEPDRALEVIKEVLGY